VLDNVVLRKIIGLTDDKVTGELRKLHSEDLYDLCSPPNIIPEIKMGRIRWAGHVTRMGNRRGSYRALEWRSERSGPLGRPRHWWKDSIKMDIQRVGWGGMD